MGASATPAASSTKPLDAVSRLAPVQLFVLVSLFVAACIAQVNRLPALASPDIWRHLSVGNWILENHTVPHRILFSQSADLPWVDSSWVFDALTASAVKFLGLRGLPFLGMACALAAAIVVFALARGARHGFWSGAVLTAIALYLLARLPLRSSLVSVVFFAVTLTLVARSAASSSRLYLLPPLFLLWANLDIQFVYGLAALVLWLMAQASTPIVRHWTSASPASQIPLRKSLIVTAVSFAATLCNPYGYHLWGAALRSISLFAADAYIPEMHALHFRQPQDYVLLLLVMTAFFAVGRRHARDLYSILLLTACSIVSFHLQRDAWLVTVAAVAVLSQSMDAAASTESPSIERRSRSWLLPASVIVGIVVVLAVFALKVPAGRQTLLAKVSGKFPVRAADYVRQHNLPEPLFNNYDWGSFLTWYLPEYPVAIDNRTDAYGEDLTLAYFKLTTGQVPLQQDAALNRAATILLEADSEMGKALATLPGYRQVYLDDQAMVLVRER